MKLSLHTWQHMKSAHHVRVDRWVQDRQARKQRGERHPIDDFLFDYYPYSVSKLRTWHPGYGITLAGSPLELHEYVQRSDYRTTDEGCTVNADMFHKHRGRRNLVLRLLTNTRSKDPALNCFGMHEWAMVYGLEQSQIRHESVPLRLSPDRIESTVDHLGLRCTHIDAFRFFTDQATALNAVTPSRENQPDLEQPGCLHANMDLYKYAMWFTPFISSELIADCFELARTARTLDMQASPYDLTAFDLPPIAVETTAGRREYITQQTHIMATAQPLRERLIAALEDLPT
jgi:hypothetical protein